MHRGAEIGYIYFSNDLLLLPADCIEREAFDPDILGLHLAGRNPNAAKLTDRSLKFKAVVFVALSSKLGNSPEGSEIQNLKFLHYCCL